MKKMLFSPLAAVGAALVLAPLSPLLAQSAYLPTPGAFEATPMYVYQSFEDFWMGRTRSDMLTEPVVQHTASVSVEYGLSERFALDTTVGYTWVDTKAFGGNQQNDDGMTDTRLGVRWLVYDEAQTTCKWAPTITLRLGGIVAGTYDEGLEWSAGDGAHGGEASLLLAKAIGETGFGLYGEAGYRLRENPVPDDFFGLIGAYKTFGSFTVNVAYRHVQSLSGSDIMDPGFTFPGLKEINQIFEAGLGYRDSGGRYYQIFGAFNVDGRNAGDKIILGASMTIPF